MLMVGGNRVDSILVAVELTLQACSDEGTRGVSFYPTLIITHLE